MSTRVISQCTDCGFVGRYKSQALADYHFPTHSCDRWKRIAEAARAGSEREAAIDRNPQPCTHGGRHEHGTYVAYTLDRCRCIPCAGAASVYNRGLARRNAYGQSNLVDSTPAREHVRQLQEEGLGLKRIAELAGIAPSALAKMIHGHKGRPPSLRITKANEAKILAVKVAPDAYADSRAVDPTGTRRRLEALIALGWTIKRLCDEHGLDRQALDRAMVHAPVQARTARAVRTMFEAVGDTPPPETTKWERIAASRARNLAESRGWVVPAEWDEADLDDPYAAPPERTTGKREAADLDEWCFLVGGGVHPEDAARRLGVSWSAVEGAIKRQDHERARRLLTEWRAA